MYADLRYYYGMSHDQFLSEPFNFHLMLHRNIPRFEARVKFNTGIGTAVGFGSFGKEGAKIQQEMLNLGYPEIKEAEEDNAIDISDLHQKLKSGN